MANKIKAFLIYITIIIAIPLITVPFFNTNLTTLEIVKYTLIGLFFGIILNKVIWGHYVWEALD